MHTFNDMSDNEASKVISDFTSSNLTKLFPQINSKGQAFAVRFSCPLETFDPATSGRARADFHARPVHDYLSNAEKRSLHLLKNTFSWIPANPNDSLVRQRLEDTYVPLTKENNHTIDYSICCNLRESSAKDLSEKFELDTIILENDENFIASHRGSGKTAFLNYWLTTKTKELEDSKKIIWFRFDVSKVQKIWRSDNKSDVTETYINYFRVHTLYVLSAYGNALSKDALSALEIESFSPSFKKLVRSLKNSFSDKKLTNNPFEEFIEEINSLVKKCKSSKSTDLSVRVIENYLSRGDPKAKERLEILSRVCEKFGTLLKESGYCALIIFDGIDNIAWTKSDRFYSDTCVNFDGIWERCKSSLSYCNTKLLLVTRPETVSEIGIKNSTYIASHRIGDEGTFPSFTIGIPKLSSIVEKKLDAVGKESFSRFLAKETIDKGKHDDIELILSGVKKIQKELQIKKNVGAAKEEMRISNKIEEIQNQIRKDYDAVEQSLSSSIREVVESDEGFLRVLFNDNTRAFLENYICTTITELNMKSLNIHGASDPSRIIEYIFLNGRPYMDTRIHLNEKGERKDHSESASVFPNIFWYNASKIPASTKWHGLVGYRLLKLADMQEVFCLGDLMAIIKHCFKYEASVIVEVVEAFVAYSIIDLVLIGKMDFGLHNLVEEYGFSDYGNGAKITQKGRFMLEYLWMRPDILYFYSLDTPLLLSSIKSEDGLIELCRDPSNLTPNGDFYAISIKTLAVFYCHLISYNRKEMFDLRSDTPLIKLLINYLYGDQSPDGYQKLFAKTSEILSIPKFAFSALKRFVSAGIGREQGGAAFKSSIEFLAKIYRMKSQ